MTKEIRYKVTLPATPAQLRAKQEGRTTERSSGLRLQACADYFLRRLTTNNPAKPMHASATLEGSGTRNSWPRISPPGNVELWTLTYVSPAIMPATCAAVMVPLPEKVPVVAPG